MSEPLLRAENLAKRYRSGEGEITVFSDLDLELARGESVAVVGASGAGKSTLLHILGALDEPSEGEVFFEGSPMSQWPESKAAAYRNQSVGYVWQSYHLLPEFTALENVIMPLLIAGEPKAKVEAAGREWLARFGLAERAWHQSGELSGGEQQRVALARALVRGPKLLLADEPTGNLDAATGGSIMDQILDLPESQGLTAIVATHNLDFARRCGRVLRIAEGRLAPETVKAV